MNINWALRLKNKATLSALIGVTVTFVYEVCGILGVVPAIGQDDVTQYVAIAMTLLLALGVIVDPTTAGVSDSVDAMNYDEPKKEEIFEVAEDAGLTEPADRSNYADEYIEDEEIEEVG